MVSLFPCIVSIPLLLILCLDSRPGGVPLSVSTAAQHGTEMQLSTTQSSHASGNGTRVWITELLNELSSSCVPQTRPIIDRESPVNFSSSKANQVQYLSYSSHLPLPCRAYSACTRQSPVPLQNFALPRAKRRVKNIIPA